MTAANLRNGRAEAAALEACGRFERGMRELAEGLRPAVDELARRYRVFGMEVDAALWRAYRAAGCPLGESREARDAWLRLAPLGLVPRGRP